MGNFRGKGMRVISRAKLKRYWKKYPTSEQALKAWYDETKKATWRTPQEVKNAFGNASFLPNNRVVFNIHGNTYRLIVAIKYEYRICYIRFVGTHAEYDKIDAATI